MIFILDSDNEVNQLCVVLATEYAFYVLKKPSSYYLDIFQKIEERFILSKNIIEFLKVDEHGDETYEDLLSHIESLDVSSSLTLKSLTEEHLYNHAQFIVDEVVKAFRD